MAMMIIIGLDKKYEKKITLKTKDPAISALYIYKSDWLINDVKSNQWWFEEEEDEEIECIKMRNVKLLQLTLHTLKKHTNQNLEQQRMKKKSPILMNTCIYILI